ncbi:MAG: hypothetical protein V3V28_04405 [Polaribacter sp.]|uniref:hypothetical protein n=1 Tax=Polaribacter sp. TaxID=1920175 RepID=UPI002F350E4F
MSENYIKYPTAFNKLTEKLVNIANATKENKANLICKDCGESFNAVLNYQTPHFRHKPNSSCEGTVESYIHWLTKEVFKEIMVIEVPGLLISDLAEKQREKFQLVYNKIIDPNIPEELRSHFKSELKRNLTEIKVLRIENTVIEKVIKTGLGDIKVDIVTFFKNKNIFFEPFFSNPIDKEKKNKILSTDTTTFSIDLNKFIYNFTQGFSTQELKKYLASDKSKKWEYISKEEFDNCLLSYELYLNDEIKKFSPYIELYQNISKDISSIEKQKVDLNRKLNIISLKISKLESEVDDLNNQRDRIFLDYELK